MKHDQRPTWLATLIILSALALSWLLSWQSFLWLNRVASGKIGWDFHVYLTAYAKAVAGQNPYEPYHIGAGFLNHPFVLNLVGPFALMPGRSLATAVWATAVSLAWTAAILVTLRLASQLYGPIPPWKQGVVFLLFLGFAPAVEAAYVGQMSALAALCLPLCYLLAHQNRPVPAGFTLALAITFKTSPVILLAYFLAACQGRVAVSTVVFLALFSGITAVQFSPQILLDFAAILPRLSAEIHPSPFNQSLLSLSYRALGGLGWRSAAASLPWVYKIVALAAVAWIGALGLRSTAKVDRRFWLFAAFLSLTVLAAPLTWYHHLLFLLPPLMGLILHPSRATAAAGLGLVLLIQAERWFDTAVSPLPLLVLSAQLLLLGLTLLKINDA